jgi:hypothetical protein
MLPVKIKRVELTGVDSVFSVDLVGTHSDILLCHTWPWNSSVSPAVITKFQFEQHAKIKFFSDLWKSVAETHIKSQ